MSTFKESYTIALAAALAVTVTVVLVALLRALGVFHFFE